MYRKIIDFKVINLQSDLVSALSSQVALHRTLNLSDVSIALQNRANNTYCAGLGRLKIKYMRHPVECQEYFRCSVSGNF